MMRLSAVLAALSLLVSPAHAGITQGPPPLTAAAGGDLCGVLPSPTICPATVTYGDIVQAPALTILGNSTASLASQQAITVGSGLLFQTVLVGGVTPTPELTVDPSVVCTVSGNCQLQGAWLDATNAGLTGTVSTSSVMAGLSAVTTPVNTGRLAVSFTGSFASATGIAACSFQIAYGTGNAPTNGAAPVGTLVGKPQSIKPAAVGQNSNLSVGANITGLTVGTQYWIDIQFSTGNAADACSIGPGNLQANEG